MTPAGLPILGACLSSNQAHVEVVIEPFGRANNGGGKLFDVSLMCDGGLAKRIQDRAAIVGKHIVCMDGAAERRPSPSEGRHQ